MFQQNVNKKKDRDAFDLQNIKRVEQSFIYFDSFYSLILANYIVIYLSLVIRYGNLLKYVTVIAQLLN